METCIVNISNREVLTPFVFYDYLLPELKEKTQKFPDRKVCLNMSGVEKISPLVLPNLMVVGKILKKYYGGKSVHLLLDGEQKKLIKFLEQMMFFSMVSSLDIFSYENWLLGDYDDDWDFGDVNILHHFPRIETTPENIAYDLFNTNAKIGRFVRHFDDENLAKTFVFALSQIVHNSMIHGKSSSFVSIYGGPKIGLHCSVADSGIGYLNSLLLSNEDSVVYTKDELKQKPELANYKSIIEALFKRFEKKTYGLASVVKSISKLGGTTRIHCLDTQVVLTQNNFSELSTTDLRLSGQELSWDLLKKSENAASDQSKSVRIRKSKLGGVHIEFEVPAKTYSSFGGSQ